MKDSNGTTNKQKPIPDPDPIFVENCVKECIADFKTVATGISAESEKWLLDTFKPKFKKKLTVSDPDTQWQIDQGKVKRNSRAMAYSALAYATVAFRTIPEIDDLKKAHTWVQGQPCGPAEGKYCSD